MSQSRGEWLQAEFKVTRGAELWVIVRHRRGWFRLPFHASVEDLVAGVQQGWTNDHTRGIAKDGVVVRIPLGMLKQLEASAAELRFLRQSGAVTPNG